MARRSAMQQATAFSAARSMGRHPAGSTTKKSARAYQLARDPRRGLLAPDVVAARECFRALVDGGDYFATIIVALIGG